MRNNTRLSVAATFYMFIFVASRGIAMSQESSQLVDTGVIFSVEQLKRSGADQVFWIKPPFWTPSPQQVALLETQLKPYLGRVKHPKAKAIAASLASYRRQYFGYTDGDKRWILVNGFCEGYWKKEDTWRDRVVLVRDGGRCFFKVRYDPSSSQFEQLEINGEA